MPKSTIFIAVKTKSQKFPIEKLHTLFKGTDFLSKDKKKEVILDFFFGSVLCGYRRFFVWMRFSFLMSMPMDRMLCADLSESRFYMVCMRLCCCFICRISFELCFEDFSHMDSMISFFIHDDFLCMSVLFEVSESELFCAITFFFSLFCIMSTIDIYEHSIDIGDRFLDEFTWSREVVRRWKYYRCCYFYRWCRGYRWRSGSSNHRSRSNTYWSYFLRHECRSRLAWIHYTVEYTICHCRSRSCCRCLNRGDRWYRIHIDSRNADCHRFLSDRFCGGDHRLSRNHGDRCRIYRIFCRSDHHCRRYRSRITHHADRLDHYGLCSDHRSRRCRHTDKYRARICFCMDCRHRTGSILFFYRACFSFWSEYGLFRCFLYEDSIGWICLLRLSSTLTPTLSSTLGGRIVRKWITWSRLIHGLFEYIIEKSHKRKS